MKVIAVRDATYAITKRKPEKIRLAGIQTLTSVIQMWSSKKLSQQANCGLVINLVHYFIYNLYVLPFYFRTRKFM